MKRLALMGFLILSFTVTGVADAITFSLVFGGPGSLIASLGGLSAGPALTTFVSDTATRKIFPLPGTFRAFAGPATSFLVLPGMIVGTYSGASPNSALIVDPSNHPLISGNLGNNSTFLTEIPDGTGAFLGSFDVTFVSPTVLAMFGLGPGTQFTKSVLLLTFAQDNFDGTTVSGVMGGGAMTIETAPAPEAVGLGLLGAGLLTVAESVNRWRANHPSNS